MSPPEDSATADRTPEADTVSAPRATAVNPSSPDVASSAPARDPIAEARARLSQQPRPEPPPQRNGFAIASFVTSLVAFFGGGLLSIIFGIIALVQIRRRGQRGKGLAIAGLAITGAHLLAFSVLLVIAAVNYSPMRDDTGALVRSGSVDAADLRTGDCLERLDGASLDYPGVPCAEPHLVEVYAIFDVDGDWPGPETLAAEAGQSCADRLATASPDAFDDSSVEVHYAYPTRVSWLAGDREVICFAEFLDGPRTGSITD